MLTLPLQAFYSNGRNVKEGDSSVKRRKPVLGQVGSDFPSLYRACIIANNVPEYIQVSKAVKCCPTKTWSGSWVQLVMQRAGYQCGCKNWGFPQLCTSSRSLSFVPNTRLWAVGLILRAFAPYISRTCLIPLHTSTRTGDADTDNPHRVKDVGLFMEWTKKRRHSTS